MDAVPSVDVADQTDSEYFLSGVHLSINFLRSHQMTPFNIVGGLGSSP
jgi:hypothetical protein